MIFLNQLLVLIVQRDGVSRDLFNIGKFIREVVIAARGAIELAAQRIRLLAQFSHNLFKFVIAHF